MVVFPLSSFELRLVKWASRVAPILAIAVLALLSSMSTPALAW